MLEIKDLHKTYGRGKPALDGVSFSVERGEVFGLLGHNGAGKSTALGIMLGMVRPDSGDVSIDGISVREDRAGALAKVGAIFESPCFYGYLSAWKNLKVLASYSGYWDEHRAREIVELVGLEKRIGEKVSTYSHGMRQRLALAQALLPQPELLLLDEPTDGLDPEGIHEFRRFILRLRDQLGVTILLNSHLLPEVEQVCGRVAIIRQGKLVFEGDCRNIAEGDPRFELDVDNWRKAEKVIVAGGGTVEGVGKFTLPEELRVCDLVTALVSEGIEVSAVGERKRTLEELYSGGGRWPSRDGMTGAETQKCCPGAREFLRQLWFELIKMFGRRRTHIGFVVFLLLEVVFAVLLTGDHAAAGIREDMAKRAERLGPLSMLIDVDYFYSALTMAHMVVGYSVVLLGGLFLALVAGDIVSKEEEDGTLRMVLSRPVTRGRLLAVKYSACLIFTLVLIGFAALSALLVAMMFWKTDGGLFVHSRNLKITAFHQFEPGVWRYLLSAPFLGLSMMVVTSLAFFFSCLRMKPATATIMTLSLLFIDLILKSTGPLREISHLFITSRMNSYQLVLAREIDWWRLLQSFTFLGMLCALLFFSGWWVFSRRDFKS